MIISEFKTLRNAIVNSCNVIDGVVDIEKNYRFKIDFAKILYIQECINKN